jgi:hypothetical protein
MINCSLPKCFPVSLPEGINIFEQFNESKLMIEQSEKTNTEQKKVNSVVDQQKKTAEVALQTALNYEKEKQISKNDIKLGLEESPKGTLNKNSKVDDDDDDRIKGLQDKLDKLISDGAANNLTEKSNISDKILIYVIVGFLVLIIIFLLQNQQK